MEPITLIAIAGIAYIWSKTKGPKRRASNLHGNLRVAADCNSWEIDEPGWYIGYAVPRWNALTAIPNPRTGEDRIYWLAENMLLGQTGSCTVAKGKPMTNAMEGLLDHVAEYIRAAPPGGNPFYPDMSDEYQLADMFEHKGYSVMVVWKTESGATGVSTGSYAVAILETADANALLAASIKGDQKAVNELEEKALWKSLSASSDIRMARTAAITAIDAGNLKQRNRGPGPRGPRGRWHGGGWRRHGGRRGWGRGALWGLRGWGDWWPAYYPGYPCPPDKTAVLTTEGEIVCVLREQ